MALALPTDDDLSIKKYLFPLEPLVEIPFKDTAAIEERIKKGVSTILNILSLIGLGFVLCLFFKISTVIAILYLKMRNVKT